MNQFLEMWQVGFQVFLLLVQYGLQGKQPVDVNLCLGQPGTIFFMELFPRGALYGDGSAIATKDGQMERNTEAGSAVAASITRSIDTDTQ